MTKLKYCVFSLSVFALTTAFAQDSNILHTIADLEHRLQFEKFEVFRQRDARFEGDMAKTLIVRWSDQKVMRVKLKRAADGGEAFNNEPRYEIAAYRLQKLFLDPREYVVPPTVCRSLPLEEYHKIEPQVRPTFDNTSSVLFLFQYWLENVNSEKIYDKKRFESDTLYAKHLGNMNILAYLINHKDSNIGNFLRSTDPANPRVFAVDNSLAFSSPESDKGTLWRRIRVKRLPRKTMNRLKTIQQEDLKSALGVVAQFEVRNGQILPVNFTENLKTNRGVRQNGAIIQFGLTNHEIKGVYDRMQKLLKRVDAGKVKIF